MKPLTRPQREAIKKMFDRSDRSDDPETYLEFRRRFLQCYGGYIGIDNWCGMFVGIETDGYTHT